MAPRIALFAAALAGLASAQHPDDTPEIHPSLTTWKCTKAGGCVSQDTKIVLDALAHPVYQVDDPSKGCGSWGSAPPADVCPDEETCQANCVMEGIPDLTQYGVFAEGDELFLDHLREDGSVLSPRVYLLSEDEQTYELLELTGNEFTFTVDVSKLPCGMNGALYLSEMAADGGKSDLNQAGAFYGTGYCDAQCYTTPFINGEPNLEGYGSCCNELDIWEANARATHLAPHPCNVTGLVECEGEECAFDGICDKNGCGYNPHAVGNPDYYGYDMVVDTSRPFTVVTQFPSDAEGNLIEYRRFYIQDGKKIENAPINDGSGHDGEDSMTDPYCEAHGATRYMDLGATQGMGAAMTRGMVLAFSVWWDETGQMTWLNGPDNNSGPCKEGEGAPAVIRENQPDTAVTFSQIKWGEIDSTYHIASNCTRGH